jgi:hypothetical protein
MRAKSCYALAPHAREASVGLVFVLGSAFTIWMAVEAVRRGQAAGWLWIILLFGPAGAAVYFFSEYVDSPFLGWRGGSGPTVTAAALRVAEADVRRLDNAATWLAYASALRARRKYPLAVEAARKAVERAPRDVDAQYELAQSLIAAGRGGDAVEPLQRVVAANRSYDSEAALFALGKAHLESDAELARTELAEVAARSSRPEFLYWYAFSLAQSGLRNEAAEVLQRIVSEAELVPPYLRRGVKPWVRKSRHALRKLGY